MKSFLIRVFLLSAVVAGFSTILTIRLAAQTPEFRLDLTLRDTLQSGNHIEIKGRSLGYDPTATDGYDSTFGEVPFYPGSFLESFNDLFFVYPGDGSCTLIDIRHKPAAGSFSIDYVMGLSFDWYPTGRVVWDPSQIPQALTGIWIRPYNQRDTVLCDMRTTSSFSITPQQNAIWNGEYLITLFYKMTPPSLGVQEQPMESAGLILSASAYPNPFVASGKLAIELAEPAMVSVVGYDATGRECLSLVRQSPAGTQLIDLGTIAAAQGAIFLHVDATSPTRHEARNMMFVKE